jgi:uncharacterized protein (TIGR03437 family)
MVSVGRVSRWFSRYRYTVTLYAGIVGAVLTGGFLTSGCHTGCSCIDNCFGGSSSQSIIGYGSVNNSAASPLSFERNIGQADHRYAFIAQGAGHSIGLAANEAVFDFPASKRTSAGRIRAMVDGAKSQVEGQAQEPMSGRVNYFKGNDSKRWITDIPTFARVTFPQIYPGIDLSYHGVGGYIENDFIVNPGADPSQIRIRFDGADDVRVEGSGSLTIAAGRRGLSWKKPIIYQATATGRKKLVEGRFRRDADGAVGFEVGVYDLSAPLVIDPVITYATYFGTPNTEGAARVATDASGNAYIIGGSNSPTFPIMPSSTYSASADGGLYGDVIVAKLSADGKQMVFTTHIGGGESNTGVGITLDASGNLFLTGLTASTDFPHTTDLTTGNILTNENCFVTKLNPAANAILYSTLIGGSNHDGCAGVGVDSTGNAYVAGTTMSTDFPTVNAAQSSLKGSPFNMYNLDCFVAKLSPDGTKLLYSTYLGGTNPDAVTGIAVDAAGNAYFTGYTTSSDFPISSSGVFQPTYGGAGGQYDTTYSTGDAFVVKMSPTGTIVYSTYLGGSQDDIGIGIAIDGQGDAYVGGATLSKNFPTLNPFQAAYGGAGGETNLIMGYTYSGGDGFVTELNPAGTALVFSSYLGGTLDDRVGGIAVDGTGNIWVTGHTLSQNFPLSQDATQKTNQGDDGGGQMLPQLGDAFLTEIGTSRTIVFSTFLGGSSADWATGIAIDGQGGVIIAGGTASTNFPTTTGAYQTKYGGIDLPLPVGDALIARFGGAALGPTPSIAGISNTASYVGGAAAPGEALLIAGTLIGPSTITGAELDATGKVSTLVAGTQFLFDGVAAPIVYVSSSYSSVIVPYEVAGKTTTQLVAVFNGVSSAPVAVAVKPALPGIFSSDASGSGTAAIINPDGSRNSPQNPAARGTLIAFFVTGEGQTTPAGVDGSVTASLIQPVLPVLVSIGGITATSFQYLGEAPGEVAGVLQINVTIPTSAPTGNVPLVVSVGTAVSQSGITVSVK